MLNRIILVTICLFLPCNTALSHFLWLATGDDHAVVFFGENSYERDYHMPESLSTAVVRYRTADGVKQLQLKARDDDEFVGLVSSELVVLPGVVESTCQYGIYHGTLLTYYAKHYVGGDPSTWAAVGPSKSQRLDLLASREGAGLRVQVLWDGKPVSGAMVALVREDAPQDKQKSRDDGTVLFTKVPEKLVGILANIVDEQAKGEIDGDEYSSATHFATLTLEFRAGDAPEDGANAANQVQPAALEEELPRLTLPAAVASFGAAVTADYLYVYGGHIGEAHAHSRENLSQRFSRVALHTDSAWEELPFETPVQGHALVAHGDLVYRIGGMTAKNSPDEDDDLHSTTDFARFDPASKKWKNLASLPSPRSSHDAVVIDDTLYVVGGWTLTGSDDGEWQTHALAVDLNDDTPAWRLLPEQPFRRRALAAGSLAGKLVVIGGIDEEGEVDKEWEEVGRLQQPRFFHRLLPGPQGDLLAIGGASRLGHLRDIEQFAVASGTENGDAPSR